MACGCKNKNRNTALRTKTIPTARTNQSGSITGPVTAQLRNGQNPINPAAVTAERKQVQAIRRDAIRRAFNK